MRPGKLPPDTYTDSRRHQAWTSRFTGVTVHYEARPSKYDCETLIVIFSSIRGKNTWLDFNGISGHTLATNRARLLYIYDDFSDEYTYYVMKSGTETVGFAVEEFLTEYIDAYGYTNDKVIFCGISKGASAAVLQGTRFRKSPIVALAPQLSLGSYLCGRTDLIFENMIGPRTETNIKLLDDLVPDAIKNESDHNRPLYILTSRNDSNCYSSAIGKDSILSSYNNLHIVVTRSKRALDHATTLHYLMPMFISLLGLLSSGLQPSFTTAHRGSTSEKAVIAKA